MGLGLSACGAQTSMTLSSSSQVFTGKMQRDFFANASNTFRGASGDFLLRHNFPTRTADSSYFVMVNTAENQLNDTHVSYKGSPLSFFWETGNMTWKGPGQFQYAGGTLIAPPEFEQQHEEMEQSMIWMPLIVAILLSSLVFVGAIVYVRRRRQQMDSIWSVKMEELRFEEPPEIVGRGTFGLVLKGEYRGTDVAVKRVMPAQEAKRICGVETRKAFNSRSPVVDDVKSSFFGSDAGRRVSFAMALDDSSTHSFGSSGDDLEAGINHEKKKKNSGTLSGSSPNPGSTLSRILQSKLSDEHSCMKKEFVREMRLLSKLRHPNIITVMGAVLDNGYEPMLVMEYMHHGSLYDLLHNRTFELEGETILPILTDISSGMRFLHCATPPVIHSDLKAANVLIDSRFRAKVADFGLSQKKKVGGGGGTPYWMAPEILLGETGNTSSSDVYSFGVVLFEVYSRQDPYEGEDYDTVMEQIKDPLINKRPPVPTDCPPQIKTVMSNCLLGDPSQRPDFGEIDQLLKKLDADLVNPADSLHTLQRTKEQNASRRRTDECLLFDVFPKHIAECLLKGQKVEPTVKDCVTIFFR